MPRTRLAVFCTGVAILFLTGPASGQFNRTAVSVNGNDANLCTTVQPCRSFTRALSQTNPGGEVIALDSGGYGAFTIDKPVTVQAAPGVYAGITVFNTDAITVAAFSKEEPIVLRGLSLANLGTGSTGIRYTAGGSLHVENLVIHSFQNYGIAYTPQDTNQGTALYVRNTTIRRCVNAGIYVEGSQTEFAVLGATASVESSFLDRNGYNLHALQFSRVVARNTVATGGDLGFLIGAATADSGGAPQVTLEFCAALYNSTGIRAEQDAIVHVSNCTISGNGQGVDHVGAVDLLSRGNNTLAGNGGPGTFTGTFVPE